MCAPLPGRCQRLEQRTPRTHLHTLHSPFLCSCPGSGHADFSPISPWTLNLFPAPYLNSQTFSCHKHLAHLCSYPSDLKVSEVHRHLTAKASGRGPTHMPVPTPSQWFRQLPIRMLGAHGSRHLCYQGDSNIKATNLFSSIHILYHPCTDLWSLLPWTFWDRAT